MRLFAFALGDKHDRTPVEVHHDGQVLVPFAQIDFVDGDPL